MQQNGLISGMEILSIFDINLATADSKLPRETLIHTLASTRLALVAELAR